MTLTKHQYRSMIDTQRKMVENGWHPAIAGKLVRRAADRILARSSGMGKAAQTRRVRRTAALGPRPRVAGEQCRRFEAGPGQEAAVLAQINALRSQGWNVMQTTPTAGWPAHPVWWACPPGQMPREGQPQMMQAQPWGAPLYTSEF